MWIVYFYLFSTLFKFEPISVFIRTGFGVSAIENDDKVNDNDEDEDENGEDGDLDFSRLAPKQTKKTIININYYNIMMMIINIIIFIEFITEIQKKSLIFFSFFKQKFPQTFE